MIPQLVFLYIPPHPLQTLITPQRLALSRVLVAKRFFSLLYLALVYLIRRRRLTPEMLILKPGASVTFIQPGVACRRICPQTPLMPRRRGIHITSYYHLMIIMMHIGVTRFSPAKISEFEIYHENKKKKPSR